MIRIIYLFIVINDITIVDFVFGQYVVISTNRSISISDYVLGPYTSVWSILYNYKMYRFGMRSHRNTWNVMALFTMTKRYIVKRGSHRTSWLYIDVRFAKCHYTVLSGIPRYTTAVEVPYGADKKSSRFIFLKLQKIKFFIPWRPILPHCVQRSV